MRNLKFGAFSLGLILAVVAAVSSLSAQTRNQVEPRDGTRRDVMVLDGRGSQLGVVVSDPSTRQGPQADAASLGAGVVVDDVHAGSPAEQAGIKSGDVIVEYDGERVRGARQFTRLVQETPEGRTVTIALLRDGKRQTVDATPQNGAVTWNLGPELDRAMREAERGMREFRFDGPNFNYRFDNRDRDNREPRRFEYRLPGGMPFIDGSRGRLGVTVQSLTPELEAYFGATNGGALVSSVAKESAAAKAGVKAGDVITSVNGKSVEDADDLARELGTAKGETTIVLLRDKKELTLQAVIEDAPRSRALIR